MNAVFLSNDPKLFDPQSAVRARMREYAALIGTVHVLSRGSGERIQEEVPGGMLVLHPISGSRLVALYRMYTAARRICRTQGIAVVTAQDPFEYGLVAVLAIRGTKIGLHLQVHTDFLSPWFVHGYTPMALRNRVRRAIAYFTIPHARGIRTVSVRVRNRITAHFHGRHVPKPSVLPIPLSVSHAAAADFPENNFTFKLLAAGRLEEEKRFDDILRALTGVLSIHPGVGLYIAGEGRQRARLEALAQRLGIADKVVFLGNRTDLFGLMQRADVFVHASAYEGYSLTLLEAALAGVPIVTTDVGVVGEVLEKSTDVRVVPIANPTALAHEIAALIEQPAQRQQLREHAGRTARAYLDSSPVRAKDIAEDIIAAAVAADSTAEQGPRLLVVTQTMDQSDTVLGFFHAWVAALASHYAYIDVICLYKGSCTLPKNVRVYSLGKERGRSPSFVYAVRFLWLAWRLRAHYDAVFVHMNQEYVLLAGWFWRLLQKPVYLWRNHYAGSWRTDVAAAFCTKVFCTSRHSYTAKYKKTVLMPVGVDLERFHVDPEASREPRSILFFSRIAPSKRPDIFIDALGILLGKSISFIASLYGSPKPEDLSYYESLKTRAESLGLRDRLQFHPGVPNAQAAAIYTAHEIFVNCSPSGMFDKTIFEAAACGCEVFATSDDFAALAGADHLFTDAAQLAELLRASLMQKGPAHDLVAVARSQGLSSLITALVRELRTGSETPV